MEICLTTSWDYTVTLEAIKATAAVITALVALATGAVTILGFRLAKKGYHTWRRQIVGKTQHDAARTVLLSALKVREEIRSVRKPGGFVAPTKPKSSFETPDDDPKRAALKQLADMYDLRLNRLRDRLLELELAVLEGEALWGSDAKARAAALVACVHELRAGVWEYFWLNGLYEPIQNVDRNPERVQSNAELMGLRLAGRGKPDAFGVSVDAALADLESFFRPKLQLQQQD